MVFYRRRVRRVRSYARRPKRSYRRVRRTRRAVIPRSMRPELKRMVQDPYALGFHSVSTSGNNYAMGNAIVQGTDYYERIGRKIRLSYAILSGTLIGGQVNGIADDPYNTIRIMVYKVQGHTGITPTLDSVVDRLHYPTLRKVIYDRKFILRSPARDSTGYMPAVKNIRWRLRLPYTIQYDATADEPVEDIMLYMVTDSVAIAHPGFAENSRLEYFYRDS